MKNLFIRLSIKVKILTFVFIAIFFMLSVGIMGYVSLNKSIMAVNVLTKQNYPKVLLVQKLKADNHAMMRFLWTTHGLFQFTGERKNQIDEAKNMFKELKLDMENIRKATFDPASTKIVAEIEKRWKDLSVSIPQIIEAYEMGTAEADKKATNTLAFEAVAQANEIHDFFKELDVKLQNEILLENKISEEKSNTLKSYIIASVCIGVILLNIIGYVFALELAKLLLNVASNIDLNTKTLSQASVQMSGISSELTSDSSKQAEAMTQTSASMVELNSMIALNTEHALKSVQISNTNKEDVLQSQTILKKVIDSIEEVDKGNIEVSNQVEQNNEKLNEIVKIILDINNKTNVINDIVFQIKILSFNASVEAARAGEHGKGFAVVAEEVGTLAQSTSKAAKEITALLNSSVDQVKNIANATSEQVKILVENNKLKVSGCINESNNCDIFLEKVVRGSLDINQMLQEISMSSNEQSKGVDEISKAVNQLSEVFQNSRLLSNKNEESSQILSNQISELNVEVDHLKGVVNGIRKQTG